MNSVTEDYDEYDYSPEKEKVSLRLRIKRAIRLAIVVAGFGLVLAGIISSVVIFGIFRVRTISVSGMVNYTNKEIIEASGVELGNNMVFSDFNDAADKIVAALPFIGTATAEKKFPSTIIFKVTPSESTYAYYSTSQSGYIITDENLKVLSTSIDVPEGVAVITADLIPESTEAGKALTFSADEDDSYDVKLLNVIITAIKSNGIKGVTSIDITDRTDVRIVYENRIMMKLGLGSEINEKISLAARVIESENAISTTQTGTMDLSLTDKAYFKPDYFDGELPGEEETEEDETLEGEESTEDEENSEESAVDETEEETSAEAEETTISQEEEETAA